MAEARGCAAPRARVGLIACETSYPPRGGPSVHVYQLWHRLCEMGYEVHTWGRQAVPGAREHPRTAEGLARVLRESDLLYARFPFEDGFDLRCAWRLLARRRTPLVCEFNAPLYELTRECVPGQLWSMRYRARLYARNHALMRACADHAICVSREMGDYAARQFGLRRVSVLPNGGDPELFTPEARAAGRRELGLGQEDFVVLWGGGTAWFWSGVEQIIGAARRLSAPNVRFLIVGDPAHLPRPLPPNVVAPGRRSYFEMPRLIAAADACLCVYRAFDWCPIGFYLSPLKLFDYMACGRAIIADNEGQVRRVIRHGENGLLTDGSPADIAAKIEALRADPERREAMGEAARRDVLERYNWQRVAERTHEIMQSLRPARPARRTSARRTVGFCSAHSGYGGTEQYLRKLARGAAEQGHQVVVFHPASARREWAARLGDCARLVSYDNGVAGSPGDAEAEGEGDNPLRGLYRAAVPAQVRFALGQLRDAWRMRGAFARAPLDALHFSDLGPDPQILAARLAGVPRLTGALNCLPAGGAAGSALARRALEALCFACVDGMAAVSEDGRRRWRRRVPIDPDRLRVVHNGTELPPLDEVEAVSAAVRRELGVPLDARVVGVSAWLVPLKGHRYLIEALPPVVEVVAGAWLLLAGDGPCRAELEAQARRLGVAGRVSFLGQRDDVGRLVCAYDVVALPSLSESLPFSLLEGMACARPAVATDVGGVRELVEDGVSGYVVPPADPAALADALVGLLCDPQAAERMGRAARRRVEERFSAAQMIAETMEMILGRSAGSEDERT